MKKIYLITLILIFLAGSLFSADSVRTRTELEAIFADTADVITKQDTRDLIKSIILSDSASTSDGTVYDVLSNIWYLGGSGDLDGNGNISNSDKNDYLRPYLEGDSTFTVEQYLTADMNGDFCVDWKDRLMWNGLVGLGTPISVSQKLTAIENTQNRFYHNGSYFEFKDAVDISGSFGQNLSLDNIRFGEFGSTVILDSANVYKLLQITSFCDSIVQDTVGTDTLFFYKDGKSAILEFSN